MPIYVFSAAVSFFLQRFLVAQVVRLLLTQQLQLFVLRAALRLLPLRRDRRACEARIERTILIREGCLAG